MKNMYNIKNNTNFIQKCKTARSLLFGESEAHTSESQGNDEDLFPEILTQETEVL